MKSRLPRLTCAVATLMAFAASPACLYHRMAQPPTPADVEKLQRAMDSRGAWVLHQPQGQEPQYQWFARGSARTYAAVNPHDGTTRPSLVFMDPDAPAVTLRQVREVQFNNRLLGALIGLGAGTVAGMLVGAIIAPHGKSNCNQYDDHCLGMDFSGFLLMASLLIGAAAGVATGVGVGQRTTYSF